MGELECGGSKNIGDLDEDLTVFKSVVENRTTEL